MYTFIDNHLFLSAFLFFLAEGILICPVMFIIAWIDSFLEKVSNEYLLNFSTFFAVIPYMYLFRIGYYIFGKFIPYESLVTIILIVVSIFIIPLSAVGSYSIVKKLSEIQIIKTIVKFIENFFSSLLTFKINNKKLVKNRDLDIKNMIEEIEDEIYKRI